MAIEAIWERARGLRNSVIWHSNESLEAIVSALAETRNEALSDASDVARSKHASAVAASIEKLKVSK